MVDGRRRSGGGGREQVGGTGSQGASGHDSVETLGAPSEAEAQELATRVIAAMRTHDRFSEWLGVEVVSLVPRACTVRTIVREEMLNGFGVCHGGVTFALADSALAFASNTHGRLTMSVENGISYVAPVSLGDVLTAAAIEEGAGGPLAFYRVTVRNQHDQPVAIFRGTVYRTKRELLRELADKQRRVDGDGQTPGAAPEREQP
jgi:acyl-CoA thioesterase